MAFPEALKAALAGQVVLAAILVHLDFKTSPQWVHLGYGKLRDANGQMWVGVGNLASLSGLEQAINGTAPQATFALSGVDPNNVAAALDASYEAKGRRVTAFAQFFDLDRKLLDKPKAFYIGVMDVLSFRAAGPSLATVSLTAESPFANRSRAALGALSDRFQKRRFPGDRGLERQARIPQRTVPWPIIIG